MKNYLDFAGSYSGEDDYIVCSDIAENLYFLCLLCADEKFLEEIKTHAREHFAGIFARLGWEARPGEKHTDALLRSFAISALGRLGDEEILNEARGRFEKFLKKPDTLNPDLRSAVYSLVAWAGDGKTHRLLTDLYKKAATQEEKTRFLSALAGFQDEELLKKTLEFSMSPDVRLQDLFIPIARMTGNPAGRKLVWPWVKENWREVAKRFGDTGSPLLNRVVGCVAVLADARREPEVRAFFRKNRVPGTERRVEQTLERIRINSRMLDGIRREFAPQ